jgi:hypothetical protein
MNMWPVQLYLTALKFRESPDYSFWIRRKLTLVTETEGSTSLMQKSIFVIILIHSMHFPSHHIYLFISHCNTKLPMPPWHKKRPNSRRFPNQNLSCISHLRVHRSVPEFTLITIYDPCCITDRILNWLTTKYFLRTSISRICYLCSFSKRPYSVPIDSNLAKLLA